MENSSNNIKVCWISPNGGNYNNSNHIGSGGWIGSLESSLINACPEIKLGIVFASDEKLKSSEYNNVIYYPIHMSTGGKLKKLFSRLLGRVVKQEDDVISRMLNAIEEFKPDLVHIWGTENFYFKIIQYLDCPNIVHIQGIASSILPAYLPASVGYKDLQHVDGFFLRMMKIGFCYRYKEFQRRVNDELKYSIYVNNWLGRTEWDRSCSYCLNSNASYFHCDEMMRHAFGTKLWKYHNRNKIVIHSTISAEWYKGLDIILRTAKVLSKLGEEIEWNVYGISGKNKLVKSVENILGIEHDVLSVFFRGKVDEVKLVENMIESDVFVHPSYIENSSNAICEAMLTGMPIVAQNVGGNSDILKIAGGVLVPANDVYSLALAIKRMKNQVIAEGFSMNAKIIAESRHSIMNVVNDLKTAYNCVLKKEEK